MRDSYGDRVKDEGMSFRRDVILLHPRKGAAVGSPTPANLVEPKTMQGADILYRVEGAKVLPPGAGTGDYVVDGIVEYDDWFLKAERLIFKSGAELHFSRQAQDSRRSFFIIAQELIYEDQAHPGKISWDRVSIAPNTSLSGPLVGFTGYENPLRKQN
jgi:hypothetical protein